MISKFLLFPYYLVLLLRNHRYDRYPKLFKSDIPVISIGNITAGGTGKTPMTELAVRMLKDSCKVAVVSRGYKRKTRGLILVSEDDTAAKVGDEPLQIKRKFPDILVVVDKNRIRAIQMMQAMPEAARPDVIILDDGFQYRKLNKDIEILLQSYNHPVFHDQLLPLGRLRDLPSQTRRADIVIVTKSPEYLDEWERDKMRITTRVRPSQKLLYTSLQYCEPKAVFPELGDNRYIYSKEVYFFSGIADDKPVILQLTTKYDRIFHKSFGDHHYFTISDIFALRNFAKKHPRALLLTTEKDAMRLSMCKNLPDECKTRCFYLPIETKFLTQEETDAFREALVGVVRTPAPAGDGLLF